MRLNDLLVVAGTAAVTIALALGAWGLMPAAFAADGEGDAADAAKAPPVLEVDGVALSLEPEPKAYKAGEKPVVVLKTVNATSQAVKLDVQVAMMTTAIPSLDDRSLPVAREAWSQSRCVELAPGETRSFELSTDVAVPEGSMVSFVVRSGDASLVGATLPVPALIEAVAKEDTAVLLKAAQ